MSEHFTARLYEPTQAHGALRQAWEQYIKPLLSRFGSFAGALLSGVEMWLLALGVRMPWTLRHPKPTRRGMRPAGGSSRPALKPDGLLSFDRNSSLMLANISHDHDQPVHLRRQNTPGSLGPLI